MTAVTSNAETVDSNASDTKSVVHDAARRARKASRVLALLTTAQKDAALNAAADAVLAASDRILAANALDIDTAKAGGASGARGDVAVDHSWYSTKADVFSEEFLLARPLLKAIRREDPTVLLIDETDKADVEIEGLLLEVLSDFAVTIPEHGTITATRKPFTVLTSNATRELSEALKRRCLFLHLDFPDADLERRILASRVPELPEAIAEQLVNTIRVLRGMQLKKVPSVSETIDWGRTLLALGMDTLDDDAVRATLGVILKHQSDQVRAAAELRLN